MVTIQRKRKFLYRLSPNIINQKWLPFKEKQKENSYIELKIENRERKVAVTSNYNFVPLCFQDLSNFGIRKSYYCNNNK